MALPRRALAAASALALCLLAAGCNTARPAYLSQGNFALEGQDAKLAAYNVAFGAVIGGVGALVNGSGDDAPALRRLARGAGWGAAGGAVVYGGKWLTGEILRSGSLAYGLPARLVHDAGVSVVENAAHDRPPLDRFASHLGFVRVDVRPASGDVRARLLPFSAAAFALMLADDNLDFALGRSLAYGTPLFISDGDGEHPIFDLTGGSQYAFLSTVSLTDGSGDGEVSRTTAAHELVHVLQHHEFVRYEAALRAPLDGPLRRSAAYQAVSRWVYLDSPVAHAVAYFPVEGGALGGGCYFNNWYELEAQAFAARRQQGVCP